MNLGRLGQGSAKRAGALRVVLPGADIGWALAVWIVVEGLAPQGCSKCFVGLSC